MSQKPRFTISAARRPLLCLGWAVVLTILFPKIAPDWVSHSLSGVLGFYHVIGESIPRGGIAAVLVALGYVQEVRTAIEDEKQVLVTERDAFQQFADAIGPMQVTTTAMPAGSVLRPDTIADLTQLERIQVRYRETVMSVPHYDEDYGEDLFEHMSEELSPEAAIAIVDGFEFTQQLKETLVAQARIAAHNRGELVQTIDAEDQSVRSAIESLRESELILKETDDGSLRERSFSELVAAEAKLSRIRDTVEETIQDRQIDIQWIERRSPAVERSTIHRYLYRELEPMFPVLDALLNRYKAIRERRRKIIRTLARW